MSYKGSRLTLRSWQYPVFLEVNKVEGLKKFLASMVKYWFWGCSKKIFNRKRTIGLKDELLKKCTPVYVCMHPRNSRGGFTWTERIGNQGHKNNHQTAKHWQTSGFFELTPENDCSCKVTAHAWPVNDTFLKERWQHSYSISYAVYFPPISTRKHTALLKLSKNQEMRTMGLSSSWRFK